MVMVMRSHIENIRQRSEASCERVQEAEPNLEDNQKADADESGVGADVGGTGKIESSGREIENAPLSTNSGSSKGFRRLNSTVFNALQEQQLEKLDNELKVVYRTFIVLSIYACVPILLC